MNGEKQIKSYKEIYPLTIICDRYSGTYSGGEYLAFNLDFSEIPTEILCDDVTCMEFWDYNSDKYIIGKGSCIDEAIDNLVELLNSTRRDGE